MSLCECVGARLRRIGMRAGVLTLELRSPEAALDKPPPRLEAHTDCDRELVGTALSLLSEAHSWPDPLRSLAVRARGAGPRFHARAAGHVHRPRDIERQRRLDAAVTACCGRFGAGSVLRGAVFADPSMAVPPHRRSSPSCGNWVDIL